MKKLFGIAALCGLLGLGLAGIAMAAAVAEGEDDAAMFVSQVRLAYNGRSSGGSDRIVGMIHVRDTNKSAIVGATVTAEWTLPNGTVQQVMATTDFQGIATVQVWAGSGTYKLCVTDVAKDGCEYDPALNIENCDEIEVTWPFSPPK